MRVHHASPPRFHVSSAHLSHPSDVAKFSWLGEAVKATNALPFEVPNKAVFLASTIAESVRAPPSLEDFQTLEGKKGFGGYLTKWAEVLKRDLDPASLQAGASALGGGREMRERPAVIITPGKVSVNNSDCFMCRVGPGATADHVGGPAACEVNDACEGMGPLEVAAAAQGQTQQDLSFPQSRYMPYVDEEGELQNSDVGLFWHELTVYCRPTDGATESDVTEGCLDRAYIKGLVMEYMGADVSKLADVAVSQMNVHDAVKPFVVQLDPDGELDTALAPEWSPECQGWSKFNVYVTTTYADAAAAVKEIWAEIVADPTTFSDAVVSNAAAAGADAELLPCFVTVERKAATTFPSLNKWPSFKPSRELGLAPSLTIGSATAIVPVESLVAGRQYTLFLQNFPQNSQIDIVLKDGTGAASVFDAAGVGSQQVLVAAIDAFDDEDGIEEVAWTAPHTPGRYFLQAFPTNVPALFATSTVFSIVDPEEAAGGEHEEHIGQRRRYHRW